jgi:hypothetical protein
MHKPHAQRSSARKHKTAATPIEWTDYPRNPAGEQYPT